MGRVRLSEVPGLLDVRLLVLFAILTVAVELGKASRLFDELVLRIVRRVRSLRGLAFAMIGLSGGLAMLLTNDVALFLVVPFTLLFRRVADVELAPIVVLEISAANLIGAWTPIGNPQNMFLYSRGAFTPGSFAVAQLPIVLAAAALLSLGAIWIVPDRRLAPPDARFERVDRLRAAAFAVLLAAEVASLARLVPPGIPLLLAAAGAALLGKRLFRTDFSLVLVFAFLFVGVAGLERSAFYSALDPGRLFGHRAKGLFVAGALLSQLVSNVPAAMLLAPAASGAAAMRGLLWGVTAGGCGTPIASIANLIGAQLYLQGETPARPFWRSFAGISAGLLVVLSALALLLLGIAGPA